MKSVAQPSCSRLDQFQTHIGVDLVALVHLRSITLSPLNLNVSRTFIPDFVVSHLEEVKRSAEA